MFRKLFRKAFVIGGAVAAGRYFFDEREGEARRARLSDQIKGFMDRAGDPARAVSSSVSEPVPGSDEAPNDQTLKEKVESEVLRGDEWPKGRINIDVAEGVVTLRGELDSEARVAELEQRVRKVAGVFDVVNLLHLPGTPAPNKVDALKADDDQPADPSS